MSGSRWAGAAPVCRYTAEPGAAAAVGPRPKAQIKLRRDVVRTADTDPAKDADKLRLLLRQVESDAPSPGRPPAQSAVVKDRLRIAEAGLDETAIAATEQKLAMRCGRRRPTGQGDGPPQERPGVGRRLAERGPAG